jgi:hypothetical protein
MAFSFVLNYILKAGKKTLEVGYFWNGCSDKPKWGLEFCGLTILDLTRKTAFHLFGFLTIDLLADHTLIAFLCMQDFRKKGNFAQAIKIFEC